MPLPRSMTTVTPLSKALAMLLLILLPFLGFYLGMQYERMRTNPSDIRVPLPGPPPEDSICTMEAKECPDGSYVGRQGPNCEFAPCPSEKNPDGEKQWILYNSPLYQYSIQYPSNAQKIAGEGSDFKIYIQGNKYPFGLYVTVDIIKNPQKKTVLEVGKQYYSSQYYSDPPPKWEPATFLGKNALKTTFYPDGDVGETHAYLIEQNERMYGISYSRQDETGATHFMELAERIVATFRFTHTMKPDGIFCGGITAISCPSGYSCKLDGDYPDVDGTCMPAR